MIRSSCIEGIPPLVIADTFYDGDLQEREQILQYLPASLRFTQKIHVILLRGLLAIARLDLKTPTPDARVLRSLISIYDSQFANLETKSPGDLRRWPIPSNIISPNIPTEKFQLICARIHILCFHFFCAPDDYDLDCLARLYSLCIEVIHMASTFDHHQNFASISPSFIDRTVTLAAFAILKLTRSPLSPHIDLASGEQAYFAAVEFIKKTSLQQNDVGTRCAGIMNQLWRSVKLFRNRDGAIESLRLRLRERFSMSVSFDMFWWWASETTNIRNPYTMEENMTMASGSTQSSPRTSPHLSPLSSNSS
jgi:transcriptional regulatory protein LEU3